MDRESRTNRLVRLLLVGIALAVGGALFYVWDVGFTEQVAKSCTSGPWPCTAVDWSRLGLILVGIGCVLIAFAAIRAIRVRRSTRGRRAISE